MQSRGEDPARRGKNKDEMKTYTEDLYKRDGNITDPFEERKDL